MKSRRRLLVLSIAVAVGLVLVSVADARGFRRYLLLRGEMAAMHERQRHLAAENRALRSRIRSLREDPEALEQAVREELGYIKPVEVVLNLE
jgi:cell division protein FtsB